MQSVTTTITAILELFIILFIGVIGLKKGIFNEAGNKKLSDLALYIVSPAIIFVSFQTEYSHDKLLALLSSFELSLISIIGAVLFSLIVIRKNAKSKDYIVERMALMYTNCGFVGIPLLQILLGSEGVFLVTGYIAVFHLVCWTYGISMLQKTSQKSDYLKVFKNPNMIAIIVGFTTYIFQIKLPPLLAVPVTQISAMNTPLSMLVVGASLGCSKLGEIFLNKRIYYITFLHNILYPILFLCIGHYILKPLGLYNPISWMTIVIATACPVGSTSTMFALNFSRNHKYSSAILGFSTFTSAISIPFILFIDTVL